MPVILILDNISFVEQRRFPRVLKNDFVLPTVRIVGSAPRQLTSETDPFKYE